MKPSRRKRRDAIADALKPNKDMAKKKGGFIVVHGKDGKIKNKLSREAPSGRFIQVSRTNSREKTSGKENIKTLNK